MHFFLIHLVLLIDNKVLYEDPDQLPVQLTTMQLDKGVLYEVHPTSKGFFISKLPPKDRREWETFKTLVTVGSRIFI